CAPLERLSGPARSGKIEAARIAALEAPLGLRKAALEVAESQPTQTAIPACLAEIGAKPDGFVVTLHRLVPVPLAGKRHPDIVPGVGRTGPHASGRSEPYQRVVESTYV